MAKISVFGIGYVGVVSAACLARDGHEVIAVDVDPGKIKSINAGLSPIVENGLDELIERGDLVLLERFGPNELYQFAYSR